MEMFDDDPAARSFFAHLDQRVADITSAVALTDLYNEPWSIMFGGEMIDVREYAYSWWKRYSERLSATDALKATAVGIYTRAHGRWKWEVSRMQKVRRKK